MTCHVHFTCMHACTCAYSHVCLLLIYMYTYIYMRIYTQTCTYIRINSTKTELLCTSICTNMQTKKFFRLGTQIISFYHLHRNWHTCMYPCLVVYVHIYNWRAAHLQPAWISTTHVYISELRVCTDNNSTRATNHGPTFVRPVCVRWYTHARHQAPPTRVTEQ